MRNLNGLLKRFNLGCKEETLNNSPRSIILPGRKHGHYSYPDLEVSLKTRERHELYFPWGDEEEVKGQFNFWFPDSFMLTMRQFVDFLQLLTSGDPVYFTNGQQTPQKVIDQTLDEIFVLRYDHPIRCEILDAKFRKQGGLMHITYNQILSDGTLKPVTEPLGDYLEDYIKVYIGGGPIELIFNGINLESWLKNATIHGLPATIYDLASKNTPNKILCYTPPRDGRFAVFYVTHDRTGLTCGDYYSPWKNPYTWARAAKIISV